MMYEISCEEIYSSYSYLSEIVPYKEWDKMMEDFHEDDEGV